MQRRGVYPYLYILCCKKLSKLVPSPPPECGIQCFCYVEVRSNDRKMIFLQTKYIFMNGYSPLHNTNMPPDHPQRVRDITKYIDKELQNHNITTE